MAAIWLAGLLPCLNNLVLASLQSSSASPRWRAPPGTSLVASVGVAVSTS